VPAGTARQFWVTVRVPEDAAPGDYTGSLTLSAGEVTVPVPAGGVEQVKVVPTAETYWPAEQALGKEDNLAQGTEPPCKVPVHLTSPETSSL